MIASRSFWLMLVLVGPLVGVSFIPAVRTYAEVSAGAGRGCGPVCAPLDGIWAPTFSAYEIAAIFLLPFVAIRQVAGDRQSGALKLELQRPVAPAIRIGAKALVLLAGSVISMAPALIAVVLWMTYGGHVYAPDVLVVLAGHFLNAALTISFAMAAASIADHPSTAAMLALSGTVGTWVLAFAGAIYGGIWAGLADYIPAALVAMFQHGLVRLDVILIALTLVATGLSVASVWTRIGLPWRSRLAGTVGVAAVATVLVGACSFVPGSVDVSESRRNSFGEAEERALQRIREPLRIEAHLAPVDPRRLELERQSLAKLKRAMPNVEVRYISRTSSGLYESADPGYGEIWYDIGGRRTLNRATTDEAVLETIFELAGVSPGEEDEQAFPGYPLDARPVGAAVMFYGVWPAVMAGLGFGKLRRPT
jgi:ABC-2 type transport system permease protein